MEKSKTAKVDNNKVLDTWLLLGPELGQKKQEVSSIVKKIKSKIPDGEELEYFKYYASDTDSESIAYEIQTATLFSSQRLLHIEQVDTWSAPDIQKIATALKSKDRDTSVLLISDETKVGASLEKLVSNKKIFWPLTEFEYTRYINDRMLSMRLSLDSDAVEQLIYFSGENTLLIDTMLLQIASFVGGTGKEDTPRTEIVTREDIDRWISHHKHETVFKLFEALSFKNYTKAMEILYSLLRSGEHSAQIMAGLVYQIKNVVKITQGLSQGNTVQEMLQSLGIRNFTTQDQYKRVVSYCTVESAQTLLIICVETEEVLRQGGELRIQEIILSIALYRICMVLDNSTYKPFTRKLKSYYNVSNTFLYDW